MITRCAWAEASEEESKYHDEEWGEIERDDRKLFENLTLEGAQAGLSWRTILNKREGYRSAFTQFDILKISRWSEKEVENLVLNAEIVRHRLKIQSVISNAQGAIRIQQEYQSFSKFLWAFVDHKPIVNHWKTLDQVPVETEISQAMSKALKKYGFKFVGPTICYAFMQASGMVNDHTVDCFKRK